MRCSPKFFSLILLVAAITTHGQSVPGGFNYQGVARDADGNELINRALTVELSILSGSPTGTIEWQEDHAVTTSEFGTYKILIGQGTTTGIGTRSSFGEVEWGKSDHFMNISIDFGSGFLDMGTIQFMSVPYAMFAEKSAEGALGEVKMFALSLPGAVTKAEMIEKGWAICDGTSPESQGITAAVITGTPDMSDRFLKMSTDESSGNSGGSNDPHNHQWAKRYRYDMRADDTSIGANSGPPSGYYSYQAHTWSFDINGNDAQVYIDKELLTSDQYTTMVESQPLFYELVFFIKVK